MKISGFHERLLEDLEHRIDMEHVEQTEDLHDLLWDGKPLPYLPCIIGGLPLPRPWTRYGFVEKWDDVEKNLFSSLGSIASAVLIRDDRLYQVRPEYGVVNIPELFGIPTVVSDEGKAMSEGLRDTTRVRELVERGIPDFEACAHTRKILEFYDFAREVLKPYKKLSRAVHFTLPDTQGPFDIACLIWGSEIFLGIYDEPSLVRELLDLAVEVFVEYNRYMKTKIGESMDSAVHIAGLKLVRGGIRVCDDSATLVSEKFYAGEISPRNARAFEPFGGGWLHYCGNGNHLLQEILNTAGVHAMHLGNPEMHNFGDLARETARRGTVLYWSGSLEGLVEVREETRDMRLLILLENRYTPGNLEDASKCLDLVRAGKPVSPRPW